jgi:L-aminopeptidase/D-esterase-like protein
MKNLTLAAIVAGAFATLAPSTPHAQAGSPANMTLTAVDGIKVGHFTLPERPTGCTVVLIESGATAGVDVSGGAPATRDTDLLNPTKMVEQVYGIAFSGGSLFGLSTGDGVLRYLEEKGVGIVYGGRHIPIVPGASIFDLGVGDGRIRPTADCGYRAAQAASAGPVVEGSVGAGAGATLGKLQGKEHAMKSGVGTAALRLPGGLVIAALVVANPLGDVIDPASG